MDAMDNSLGETRQSACYRCHSQKLRCVQLRGQKRCVRCARAEAQCVTRPSKRSRRGNQSIPRREGVSPDAFSHCNIYTGSRGTSSEVSSHGKGSPAANIHGSHACGLNSTPSLETLSFDHGLTLPTVNSTMPSSQHMCCNPGVAPTGTNLLETQNGISDSASVFMELVSEWTNEQVSLHDNIEDRSYLSNTEEDRENEWIEALFNLNAKLGKNQRAILKFNPACEKGFVNFEASKLNTNLDATVEWRGPKLQPACPFEETFNLSMQLLLLIGNTSQRRTELDTSVNINAFTGFETFLANGASNPASSESHTYLGDKANLLLLLSCYTRLLGSLCSMLECFNRIIATSDKDSSDHAIRYIHSFLPRIQMGKVSLCANPRFDLAMVLNSAESTLIELTECIRKKLLTDTLERPSADMPAISMDCFLEQSDRSSLSDQGDSTEVTQSWQTTIRDINSTALEKINMLKKAV